jgi:hypothetical protein
MTAPTTWTPDTEAALARIRGHAFATVTEASAILRYDAAGRTVRKAIAGATFPPSARAAPGASPPPG